MSLKSSWLFLLIPLGILFFVLVPELESKYERYNSNQTSLHKDIYLLDSLKQIHSPTTKDKHLIKKLEITLPIHTSSSGSYFSYELNLITQKGDRFNLLNHDDKQYLLSDMMKISKLLKVSVWNKNV